MLIPPGLPEHLVRGYTRFREGRYLAERDRYFHLADAGQRPTTLVIACSDSRSAPDAIFDAGPGELFVVRNVAGLVPVFAPDARAHGASAALEYAVLELAVSSIVVLGHGRCGGIAAASSPSKPLSSTDFLGAWVSGIRQLAEEVAAAPVVAASATTAAGPGGDQESRRTLLERRSVERSLDNLETFPWIHAATTSGRLTTHGAWFDIAVGELHALAPGGWVRVDPA